LAKGEAVADPTGPTFAINMITANFIHAGSVEVVAHEIIWKKPARGCYKLNSNAAFHVGGSSSQE
jgi:hypothetical protein